MSWQFFLNNSSDSISILKWIRITFTIQIILWFHKDITNYQNALSIQNISIWRSYIGILYTIDQIYEALFLNKLNSVSNIPDFDINRLNKTVISLNKIFISSHVICVVIYSCSVCLFVSL